MKTSTGRVTAALEKLSFEARRGEERREVRGLFSSPAARGRLLREIIEVLVCMWQLGAVSQLRIIKIKNK